MNGHQQKTSYLPWVLFGVALLGCLLFVFLFMLALAASIFPFGGSDIYPTRGNLAVVEVEGIIKDSKRTVATLDRLKKDKRVKAIVLRVDSPGGAVAPAQEIHDKVGELAKDKVLVASLGTVAASGGYYVSVPARKIIANPGSVTGSIGVLLELFVAEELLKKLYLDWTVIKSGEVKDMGSPLRKLTPKEVRILQGVSANIHKQFMKAVSVSRKIPMKEVKKIADGRIFTGEQAQKIKLVDELGSLDKACSVAAKMAGIKGDPKIFYPGRQRKTFLRQIFEETTDKILDRIWERIYLLRPMFLPAR